MFLGSKITADGGCSHEIKRCLFLGRKVMTKLESLLMRVKKESEKRRVKAGLKFSLIKSKIMAFIQSHHFMANRRGKSGRSD